MKRLLSPKNWRAKALKSKLSIFVPLSHSTPTLFLRRSRVPDACFALENHFRGAAPRLRSLRASLHKAFIYSMPRLSALTRKTPPSHITQISGRRIVRTQKRLREKPALCFENKIYAASSDYHAAA